MTSSAPFRRFAFTFGTTFGVCYVVALAKDFALFTVFPSLGIVLAGTHHSQDVADPSMGFLAPAMYWYGWTATAALGATMVGLVAASFSGRSAHHVWPGWVWVIPILSMIACVYLTCLGFVFSCRLFALHSNTKACYKISSPASE